MILIKNMNRRSNLTSETESQDAKKLPEKHDRRPNHHIIGSFCIQH